MGAARRMLLGQALGTAAVAALPWRIASAQGTPISRTIPSTGEAIPAVGLGTWITFNVGDDPQLRGECAQVVAAFFAGGGRMIDSSPMYGSSQAVVGAALAGLEYPPALFAAEKVWTSSASGGPGQIERSRAFWGVPRFDLLQVHNLLAWEAHLETLLAMKAAGRVRHVGITTSEGRRHDLMERIMRGYPLDFVQLSYNPLDREAEALLSLAQERGIGVIVNRPFRQGALTRRLEGEALPGWVAEAGAASWAQAILKFVLAHPAVTVAIPATSRVEHVRENLAAASAPLPDEVWRERLAAHLRDL